MARSLIYNGNLTESGFLFREMKITARLYLEGHDADETAALVLRDNLFQRPTERKLTKLARSCYRRVTALENDGLIRALCTALSDTAKQICLYAIMRDNALVWDFMTILIGGKFRDLDFHFSRKDLNGFFTQLQEQREETAAWKELSVKRIKSTLMGILAETGYISDTRNRDEKLYPVILSRELETGIRENGDWEAFPAFNSFRKEKSL